MLLQIFSCCIGWRWPFYAQSDAVSQYFNAWTDVFGESPETKKDKTCMGKSSKREGHR